MLRSKFSAKKLAFFLNTNVKIKLFSKFSFVLSQKRQFFAEFFVENIFKNHSIGPRTRLFPSSQPKKLELEPILRSRVTTQRVA
jgi:hypothetical protein